MALRLIVERERDIRAFTPQEYWSIEALLAKDGQTFEAALAKVDGHKPQLHSAEDGAGGGGRGADAAVRRQQGREAQPPEEPAAPFTTSTIQQEAAKKLGFSSRRTMRAAQDLYEGMDVGEDGPVGLITYMRTDSVRVSRRRHRLGARVHREELRQALPARVPQRLQLAGKNARFQDAHEAIRPTDARGGPSTSRSTSSPTSSGCTSSSGSGSWRRR